MPTKLAPEAQIITGSGTAAFAVVTAIAFFLPHAFPPGSDAAIETAAMLLTGLGLGLFSYFRHDQAKVTVAQAAVSKVQPPT